MNAITLPTEPPIAVLLGLPFHDVTLEETLEYCGGAMAGEECRYVVTANVDFTTQAYEDADLRKIVFFADRVVCDGMPLVWLSKAFGYPLRERVAGSDMVPRLLEMCGKRGHGVYFFGSDLQTLEEAKEIVEERYPGLRVSGMDSPPVGAVVEWDNEEICRKMRESGAKLLLVCLGCPKQERWIFAHHQETGVPLSIGVGASLDFITGKQRRAPVWMQKTGLEWFWRMAGNPKRLASRYGHDFVFLVKASLAQAMAQRKRRGIADGMVFGEGRKTAAGPGPMRLVWEGSLENGKLEGAPVPPTVDRAVLLDASAVTFIDSSGLGRMALLLRRCRAAGKGFVLLKPSFQVRQAVRAARMDALFAVADSEQEAVAAVEESGEQGVASKEDDGVVKVAFPYSLDALHHEEMMAALEGAMGEEGIKALVVDLRAVDFIDSRAVGGLIRARKMMAERGGELYLWNANPAVRQIISLLRLDKVLPEWKEADA